MWDLKFRLANLCVPVGMHTLIPSGYDTGVAFKIVLSDSIDPIMSKRTRISCTFSLDGRNSIFSWNKYYKFIISHVWLFAAVLYEKFSDCPKSALLDSGGEGGVQPLAYTYIYAFIVSYELLFSYKIRASLIQYRQKKCVYCVTKHVALRRLL